VVHGPAVSQLLKIIIEESIDITYLKVLTSPNEQIQHFESLQRSKSEKSKDSGGWLVNAKSLRMLSEDVLERVSCQKPSSKSIEVD
jgi:hypothetical protein